MLALGVSTAPELRAGLSAQATRADKASYAFASVLGLGLIAMYRLLPAVGAPALGFLRGPSVIERGRPDDRPLRRDRRAAGP